MGHNEVHAEQIHGTIVQAERIDRVVVGPVDPATYPPLIDWWRLPKITPGLADLLIAQREAVDTLPYRLLGVRRPELAKVYVQQRIREGGDRQLSVAEALNQGGHVVILGEPGAGKSTLGHMYVQRICDHWLGAEAASPPLDEPFLAVRVPARALAEDRSWSESIAAGVRDAVGRLLTSPPDPALFAHSAFGARWLVFIDGLDEIANRQVRGQVIHAITSQMRRSEHYRIVVTTRPLSEKEMEPFKEVGAESYTIQPFREQDLDEFAGAWFRAQDPLTAQTRAADFVRQVRDRKLRDLVRNPLLATIAAIAHTLEPHRELPRSVASLYQRFMDYLLTDEASGRRTRDELRRTLADKPDRLALAIWMDDHRVEIIERAAVGHVGIGGSALPAAVAWIAANRTERPPGWEQDLRALLSSSGVFARDDDDLSFSHQSFAEFLAARHLARDIGPDFSSMDVWIAKGLLEASQGYAVFAFVLWGAQGNDIAKVFHRLLDKDHDSVLLAGRLLAEDIPVARDLAAEVVQRLVHLLLISGLSGSREAEKIREVLIGIGAHRDLVLDRVVRIRDDIDLSTKSRIEAAVVAGALADREAAVRWLLDRIEEGEPDDHHRVVEGLIRLGARDLVEEPLMRLARGVGDGLHDCHRHRHRVGERRLRGRDACTSTGGDGAASRRPARAGRADRHTRWIGD